MGDSHGARDDQGQREISRDDPRPGKGKERAKASQEPARRKKKGDALFDNSTSPTARGREKFLTPTSKEGGEAATLYQEENKAANGRQYLAGGAPRKLLAGGRVPCDRPD